MQGVKKVVAFDVVYLFSFVSSLTCLLCFSIMSFAKYKKRCWTTERTLVDRLDLLREAAPTGKDTSQLEQETELLLSEVSTLCCKPYHLLLNIPI
jgi:biopolymer transport protein ExbB/TolQ